MGNEIERLVSCILRHGVENVPEHVKHLFVWGVMKDAPSEG